MIKVWILRMDTSITNIVTILGNQISLAERTYDVMVGRGLGHTREAIDLLVAINNMIRERDALTKK